MLSCSVVLAKTITIRLNEWPSYVSMHADAIINYASKQGIALKIEVVKPNIADEQSLFHNVRSNKVDILTPTESFFHSRHGKLIKIVSPVDPTKVVGYEHIPKTLRMSRFHMDEQGNHYGIVFMVGYYGLYYNKAKVEQAPSSWAFLWSEEAKGKYSVSKDTYFVNAHISQWAIDAVEVERAYHVANLDMPVLRKKMQTLAENAHHLWAGIGNTAEELQSITYTASWGFELGPEWKLALPTPGSPMWVDTLSITKEAAADPDKLKAFYIICSFVVSPEAQAIFAKKLRAIPLALAQGKVDLSLFDDRFFWHPLDDRTANYLQRAWEKAIAAR